MSSRRLIFAGLALLVSGAAACTQDSPSAQTGDARAASQLPRANEKQALIEQIERHWNPDPATVANKLIVRVHVTLRPDGTVITADFLPDPRYGSDPAFTSAADSARNAVLAASPLRLPPGKYEVFKNLVLVFDPREASAH